MGWGDGFGWRDAYDMYLHDCRYEPTYTGRNPADREDELWKKSMEAIREREKSEYMAMLNSPEYKQMQRIDSRMLPIRRYSFKDNIFRAEVILKDGARFTVVENFIPVMESNWRATNGLMVRILGPVTDGYELRECKEDPDLHVMVEQIKFTCYTYVCKNCRYKNVCYYERFTKVKIPLGYNGLYERGIADKEVDVSFKMPKSLAIDTAEWHNSSEGYGPWWIT